MCILPARPSSFVSCVGNIICAVIIECGDLWSMLSELSNGEETGHMKKNTKFCLIKTANSPL